MQQRGNYIRSMESGVLPPALKRLTLVSAEHSVFFLFFSSDSKLALFPRVTFKQSHNYMKRFHGLVLPQFLEELYLVPQSHGEEVAFFTCILNLVCVTELQLYRKYGRCGGWSALDMQSGVIASGKRSSASLVALCRLELVVKYSLWMTM